MVRWSVTCVSYGVCVSRGWGSRTRKGRSCLGLKDFVVNLIFVVILSLMWVWCFFYWRILLNIEYWNFFVLVFLLKKFYIWLFYFLFDVFIFCLIGLFFVWWYYFLFFRFMFLMRRFMLGVLLSSGRDWVRSCLSMRIILEFFFFWIWTWMLRLYFLERCFFWLV